MKELLLNIGSRMVAASATQKAIAAVVLIAALAIGGVGSWLARQPHWEVLVSELDDREYARVGEALASSGVRWRSSQPPRPFVVYVASKDRPTALNAIMQSGAMSGSDGGILTSGSSGMGSVFLYSKEREQLTRKKEWQDMEAMLEFQDFIREARVRTSVQGTDLLGRGGEPTASVTLVLQNDSDLSRTQKLTIANLVRLGLGVAPENLVVSDQNGSSLFDGEEETNGSRNGEEWVERAEEEDRRLTEDANQLLEEILGPGMARVMVRSEWDLDQSKQLIDSTDPKERSLTSESKRTSTTPYYGPPSFGGASGSSGNLNTASEFGVDNQGVVDLTRPTVAAPQPTMGKTSEESAIYAPTRTLSETVRKAPKRVRMSVSLWLDESLADKRETLEQTVRAAVAFDPSRPDQFESALVPFAKSEGVSEPIEETETIAPNPILELLLTRGVEAVAALFFLIVLALSLRKSKRSFEEGAFELEPRGSNGESAARSEEPEPEIDPELLALERVRKLVDEEPDKVGALLTAWARGDEA